MNYVLTSVDWNHPQTKVWKYHAEKHCRNAEIVLIPDTKPLPWCWSGGKLACFNQGLNTDRLIYMDTDTIVTHDLEPIFDMMKEEGKDFALSPWNHFQTLQHRPKQGPVRRSRHDMFPLDGVSYTDYRHYSSGFIAVIGKSAPKAFHDAWMNFCMDLKSKGAYNKHMLFEEIALSWMIALVGQDLVWNIPTEIHNNILPKQTSIEPFPWVIHYHKPERLKRCRLERFLHV